MEDGDHYRVVFHQNNEIWLFETSGLLSTGFFDHVFLENTVSKLCDREGFQ